MFKTGDTVIFRRSAHDPEMAVVIEDQSEKDSLVEVFIGSMADYEALEAAYEYAGWDSSVVNIKNDERAWLAYPTEIDLVGIPNHGSEITHEVDSKSKKYGECGVWGCSTCL